MVEDIVICIKKGDMSLYRLIIEKFQRRIYIYCYQLLGNIQEAEDATQDIFIKAYEKLKSYDNKASFSAWLYKIAYNHCISLLRKQKLIQFIPFADMHSNIADDRVEKHMDYELSEKLQSALKILPAESKSILFLRIFEEKSYDEIGKILNLKSSTARKRYERARRKLVANLSDMKGELTDGNYAAY